MYLNVFLCSLLLWCNFQVQRVAYGVKTLHKRGATTSDLRANFEKSRHLVGHFQSNDATYKTTDPQQVKLKKGRQVEVAGVTFSDADSALFPKFFNPDPAIFQI